MNDKETFKAGDEVELEIEKETDLGFKVIINNAEEGLLYHNEIFERLKPGDVRRGYIKQVRADGKIDVTLQKQGYEYIDQIKHIVLMHLKANKGVLPLGDNSSPLEIYDLLKISKKAFKKAIGALYKDRLITLSDDEIKLFVDNEAE